MCWHGMSFVAKKQSGAVETESNQHIIQLNFSLGVLEIFWKFKQYVI